jgi:hypothetical protein
MASTSWLPLDLENGCKCFQTAVAGRVLAIPVAILFQRQGRRKAGTRAALRRSSPSTFGSRDICCDKQIKANRLNAQRSMELGELIQRLE